MRAAVLALVMVALLGNRHVQGLQRDQTEASIDHNYYVKFYTSRIALPLARGALRDRSKDIEWTFAEPCF